MSSIVVKPMDTDLDNFDLLKTLGDAKQHTITKDGEMVGMVSVSPTEGVNITFMFTVITLDDLNEIHKQVNELPPAAPKLNDNQVAGAMVRKMFETIGR